MNLTLRTDNTLVPAGTASTRHLLVSFTAPPAPPRENRTPISAAFVLDRSGSMHGAKFDLARDAVAGALRLLRDEDRFAVVVYDDDIEIVFPAAKATSEARRSAIERLAAIGPRGSTDLTGGWQAGCEQIGQGLAPDTIARCLLLTDGLANVGIVDHGDIRRLARERRAARVTTTTFGVGADFDERLLQQMADEGGGHFYFIQAAGQIPDFLASELGEALEVVAHDAALVLRLPEGASAAPLGPMKADSAGRTVRIELGDLVSNQDGEVLVRLALPAAMAGDELQVEARLTDRDRVLDRAAVVTTWVPASTQAVNAAPRDRRVVRVLAEIIVAAARAEAIELNRAGKFAAARKRVERAVAQLQEIGAGRSEIEDLLSMLGDDVVALSAEMAPIARKAMFAASQSRLRNRTEEGKARRR